MELFIVKHGQHSTIIKADSLDEATILYEDELNGLSYSPNPQGVRPMTIDEINRHTVSIEVPDEDTGEEADITMPLAHYADIITGSCIVMSTLYND